MITTNSQKEEKQTVNPTPHTGENPSGIGDVIAKKESNKLEKKWKHKRKRKPQSQRLQEAITLLQTHAPKSPEQEDLLQTLLEENNKPEGKSRLKTIYRAEEKLQEWGLKEEEKPTKSSPQIQPETATPTPDATPKEKLIQEAIQIEAKIEFCKNQGIKLKSSKNYETLQKETIKAISLPPKEQNLMLEKLLKKTQKTHQEIILEHDDIQQKKVRKKNSQNWWFRTKLKVLIALLLPEKDWPKAAKILESEAKSGNYPPKGAQALLETSTHLNKGK